MASQKKPVTLQRPNNTLTPVHDERAALAKLHNLFEARVKAPSPNDGTLSLTTTGATTTVGAASKLSSPRHPLITSPCNKTPTARASNILSSGPTSTAGRLLNDPLLNLGKVMSEPVSVVKGRAGKGLVVTNSIKERICQLCKITTPLNKQAFIDHIMGKRHRVAEYKQKLTKEQKEDKDARTLHVRGQLGES